jgi:hypothetical protein
LGFVMWSLTRLTRRGGDDRNWWALKRMLAVKKSKQNSRHGTGSEAIELTLRQAGSQAAVWSSFRQPYQRTLTKKSMHVRVIVIAMVNFPTTLGDPGNRAITPKGNRCVYATTRYSRVWAETIDRKFTNIPRATEAILDVNFQTHL